MAPTPIVDQTPVALITGASRGIGKAIAIWLARAGFDVAITARTVAAGEQREHSQHVGTSDTTAVPGSLSETATLVCELGRRALVLPADLLDHGSLGLAVGTVLERWGRIDVLVNNGRYVGPGHLDCLLDTPLELLERQVQANVIAPLALIKMVLPGMIEQGGGTVVNITSAAAYADPTRIPGRGGWGLGYAVSKGGMHRIAGMVALELGGAGIRAFNVQPGSIAVERHATDLARKPRGTLPSGEPPDVVGSVVAWLVTSPGAAELSGSNIEAQELCWKLGLLPDWEGPRPYQVGIRFDTSASHAMAFDERLIQHREATASAD